MRIAIAADFSGLNVKNRLEPLLVEEGHLLEDYGVDGGRTGEAESVARLVAEAVAAGDFDRGILLGAGGQRESIVANRVPGVRCALCWDMVSASWSRRVEDANVLALPWGRLDFDELIAVTQHWLETPTEVDHRANGRLRAANVGRATSAPHVSLPHCIVVEEDAPFVCNWCRAEFQIPIDVTGGGGVQVEECPVCSRENIVLVEIDETGAVVAHDSHVTG